MLAPQSYRLFRKLCHHISRIPSFHHCGWPVKLVKACVWPDEAVSTAEERCCDARASLCNCQEWSRKQFSPLWRSCLRPRKDPVYRCLFDARTWQSRFNRYAGTVNHEQAWLSAKDSRERGFYHSGGLLKQVQACLRPRKQFSLLWTSYEACLCVGKTF